MGYKNTHQKTVLTRALAKELQCFRTLLNRVAKCKGPFYIWLALVTTALARNIDWCGKLSRERTLVDGGHSDPITLCQ